MDFLIVLLVLLMLFVLLVPLTIAGAVLWYRRGQRRAEERFGDPAQLIRRRGADERFDAQLRALALDSRTPRSARTWLDRLIRYRRDPIVLAPESIPVLGKFDEVVVESFLLRQAWRSLPPPLWAEHFPRDHQRHSEPIARAVGLAATLAELERDGRHDQLLRTLDRRLPAWPISTALIDTARELLELDRNLDVATQRGIPNAISERLADEARFASDALWDLADRLTVTASFGVSTDGLSERLDEERERLAQLGTAVREARTGLAELMLSGTGGRQDFERAERRFRALARTAGELRELDA